MSSLSIDLDALTRFGRALAHLIHCRILLALRDALPTRRRPRDLRTRLSNRLACLRHCGLVVIASPTAAAPGTGLRTSVLATRSTTCLRTVVVAVETDRTCPDAEAKGCC